MLRAHVVVATSAALLCCFLGCDRKETPERTDVFATARPVTPAAPASSPTSLRGGPGKADRHGRHVRAMWREPGSMLFHAALTESTLTDEQRAKIDAARNSEQKPKEAMSPGVDEFKKTLADQVKAGKVDTKALEPQLEAIRNGAQQLRAAHAKELNELHAILTPEQRKAVADVVRNKLEQGPPGMMAMEGGMMPRPSGSAEPHHRAMPHPAGSGAPHAHDKMPPPGAKTPPSAVPPPSSKPVPGGKPVPGVKPPLGAMARGVPAHHAGGPLGWEMMSKGLELTEDQQKKLDDLQKKSEKKPGPAKQRFEAMHEEFRKDMLELLDAFEKDTFDATTLALLKSQRAHPDWMKTHLEQIGSFVAILTPEQREKLAKQLLELDEHWQKMTPSAHPGAWDGPPEEAPRD